MRLIYQTLRSHYNSASLHVKNQQKPFSRKEHLAECFWPLIRAEERSMIAYPEMSRLTINSSD
eukprot:scaffold100844_cov20-Prasinocladus_malaysianus.AAC.2